MKITTQKQVETVPAKGTPYALGNNLYLDVRSATSRAWLFIWKQKGRNRYAGLGSASGAKGHKVTLIEARRKADSFRACVASGIDPRAEEKRQTTLLGPFADGYIASIADAFRSPKTAPNWRLSLHHPCRRAPGYAGRVDHLGRHPRRARADLVHPQGDGPPSAAPAGAGVARGEGPRPEIRR